MKKSFFLFSLLFFVSFYIIGCASMSDVIGSKDEGTVGVYDVTKDQAWDISIAILRWSGTDAIEEHKSQGYMLTSKGQNLISWGSMIGVWVEPIDEHNTKVTVVTKRKLATNLATGFTEGSFQRKFAQTVKIIKSGKPIPIEEPDFK